MLNTGVGKVINVGETFHGHTVPSIPHLRMSLQPNGRTGLDAWDDLAPTIGPEINFDSSVIRNLSHTAVQPRTGTVKGVSAGDDDRDGLIKSKDGLRREKDSGDPKDAGAFSPSRVAPTTPDTINPSTAVHVKGLGHDPSSRAPITAIADDRVPQGRTEAKTWGSPNDTGRGLNSPDANDLEFLAGDTRTGENDAPVQRFQDTIRDKESADVPDAASSVEGSCTDDNNVPESDNSVSDEANKPNRSEPQPSIPPTLDVTPGEGALRGDLRDLSADAVSASSGWLTGLLVDKIRVNINNSVDEGRVVEAVKKGFPAVTAIKLGWMSNLATIPFNDNPRDHHQLTSAFLSAVAGYGASRVLDQFKDYFEYVAGPITKIGSTVVDAIVGVWVGNTTNSIYYNWQTEKASFSKVDWEPIESALSAAGAAVSDFLGFVRDAVKGEARDALGTVVRAYNLLEDAVSQAFQLGEMLLKATINSVVQEIKDFAEWVQVKSGLSEETPTLIEGTNEHGDLLVSRSIQEAEGLWAFIEDGIELITGERREYGAKDVLTGMEGDDLYAFALHFGSDVIRDEGSKTDNDTIAIQYEKNAVVFEYDGEDLIVRTRVGDQEIRVEGQFASNPKNRIEWIEYGDGVVEPLPQKIPVLGDGDDVAGNGLRFEITARGWEETWIKPTTPIMGVNWNRESWDTSFFRFKEAERVRFADRDEYLDPRANNFETFSKTVRTTATIRQMEFANWHYLFYADYVVYEVKVNGEVVTPQKSNWYFNPGAGWDALTLTVPVRGVSHKDWGGGGGDDRVVGDSRNNDLFGDDPSDPTKQGNDHIDGGHGNDNISGQGGDDTLIGGGGSDRIVGGDGNDTIISDGNDKLINGGRGYDKLQMVGDTDDHIDMKALHVEAVEAGAGDDVVDGSGKTVDLKIKGEAGNDHLIGGAGDDVIDGGEGADKIEGRQGDDLLHIDADDIVVDGGEGYDTAEADENALEAVELDLTEGNIERALGTRRADVLDARGSSNDVEIDGRGGDDSIYGGSGDDLLHVRWGVQLISGGAGFDTYRLYGTGNRTTITDGDGRGELVYASDWASLDRLAFYRVGDDLLIRQHSSLLRVEGQFGGGGIERIRVEATGEVLEAAEIEADSVEMPTQNGVIAGTADADSVMVSEIIASAYDAGSGDDTYELVGWGEEELVITDSAGSDTLLVDDDLWMAEFLRDGDDLLIEGFGSPVRLKDHFGAQGPQVESLESTWWPEMFDLTDTESLPNLRNLISADSGGRAVGTEGDDLFRDSGLSVATVVEALGGDDQVYGTAQDDTVDLGAGRDSFNDWQGGDDTVRLGSGRDNAHTGDGNDTIYFDSGRAYVAGGEGDDVYRAASSEDHQINERGGADRLVFEHLEAKDLAEVSMTKAGYQGRNLEISHAGVTVATITYFFYEGSSVDRKVETLELADGSEFDLLELQKLYEDEGTLGSLTPLDPAA